MFKCHVLEIAENQENAPALTRESLVVMQAELRDLTQSPNGWPRLPLAQRFAQRVTLADGDGCWGWTGLHDRLGYSRIHGKAGTTYAHRLSYGLMVGPTPEGMELDHICRNRGCVNPAHLRPCTHSENLCNVAARAGTKSGLKGVSWHKAQGKWASRIMVNGRSTSLGYFTDPNEAHEAYRKAARELHGEFAHLDELDLRKAIPAGLVGARGPKVSSAVKKLS